MSGQAEAKPKGKHGGRRPGAGRKPKHEPTTVCAITDPAEYLEAVMTGLIAPNKAQLDAAKALLAHQDGKNGIGKKGLQGMAADRAAGGRFGAQPPPAGAPQLQLIKG